MAGNAATPGPEHLPSMLAGKHLQPGRIDEVLNALSDLAQSESSEQGFYAKTLESLVDTLGVAAGAVWKLGPDGRLALLHDIGFDAVRGGGATRSDQHQALLLSVCRHGSAQFIRPREQEPGSGVRNPFDSTVLIKPICHPSEATMVIELVLAAGPNDEDGQRQLRVLDAVEELSRDFERNRQLRRLQARTEGQRPFEHVVRRLHSTLDLRNTASRIVNDGRHFVGCDRITVAACRGSRVRVEDISGLSTFDRRSPSVRLLELLASRALAAGEPVWSDQLDAPPQIVEPLETYQDESHVHTIGIVPLAPGGEGHAANDTASGVIIFEQFTQPLDGEQHRRAQMLALQAAVAIRNALQYEAIPLRGFLQAMGGLSHFVGPSRVARTALIGLAVLLLVLALVVVKVDFTIEARGAIQPLRVRQIFAPGDGVVQQVGVDHGQQVSVDETLLHMRDPQLNFELQRVLGEMQTARQRLAGVETQRLGSTTSGSHSKEQHNQLTVEKEELQQLLQSLDGQHEILKRRRQQLNVVSPMDGEVITWDVRKRLDARPVKRGQVLMSVADTSGPWILELEVSEEDVMHIHRARADSDEGLRLDYVLATDPSAAFSGRLSEIAPAAQSRPDGERTVSVRANVQIDAREATPGATAIAKIHCGRRAIGYVWLRDLFDAVRARWVM